MKKVIAIALFSTIAAVAAAEEGKSAMTAAKPTEKMMAAAKGDDGFPPGRYDIDAGHSVMLFKIRHLGVGYTYGWFKDVTGSVMVDRDTGKESIDLTVKTASVDSRDAKRDEHLRSPDFFNAAQFPTITFKSTKIERAAGNMLAVTGNLTIHGVTKPITAKVAALGTGPDPLVHAMHVGYETTMLIKRSDFGMNFMAGLVGDEVELTIGIEAFRGGDAMKK